MRLSIDTSGVQCQVTKNSEQKLDQNGKQKIDRDGKLMWTTQVMALDATGGEVLNITVAGVQPSVTVGQIVKPSGWRRSRGTTTGSTAWRFARWSSSRSTGRGSSLRVRR